VIVVARNEGKAEQVVREITQATKNQNVRYEIADLSRLVEIQALATRWKGPLNILVNNAAVTPLSRKETPEGIEMQFATNVLGYFRMTQAFQDVLRQSTPARIVDVASYWAGGLNLKDLEFKQRTYRNGAAYRQSKQANRMLAVAWAQRLISDGVHINVCHPGDVNSTLSNNLGFGGSESPDQGAGTPVWLATDPIGHEVTGKYFEHKRETRCRFGENEEKVEALFQICLSYT
jgi:NAD(P)-dependent dehydrogenase (short-subunit alcohol dehydrogenase family)